MKVLIISSNSLPGASPAGPAYVAGALRQAGHTVEAYESLLAADVSSSLAAKLNHFQPDVVGISIRLVHGDVLDASAPLGTRHLDLRPRVKEIVEAIRKSGCIPMATPFDEKSVDWCVEFDMPIIKTFMAVLSELNLAVFSGRVEACAPAFGR